MYVCTYICMMYVCMYVCMYTGTKEALINWSGQEVVWLKQFMGVLAKDNSWVPQAYTYFHSLL